MLVGITGGVASGKTAFAGLLGRMGFQVFYADDYVNSLYRSQRVLTKVRAIFGEGVFRNGILDKGALAEKAFSSRASLSMLEGITHPEVRRKLKTIKRAPENAGSKKIVFAEVPVLFEAGMQGIFDKIILVKCPESVALARWIKKGFGEAEFRRRSGFQLPLDEKEKLSDFVVDSNCPVSALGAKAERISKELLQNNRMATVSSSAGGGKS